MEIALNETSKQKKVNEMETFCRDCSLTIAFHPRHLNISIQPDCPSYFKQSFINNFWIQERLDQGIS
jgi:hypothetical protein